MTFPASFDKERNVIDEFMLKEYESIAAAHFDSQNGLRQQFRFYLLIAAVPLTVLGLAFRDQPAREPDTVVLLSVSNILGFVFVASGVLGMLMLLSMVHTALDASLYARTVNGIRSYFVDRGTAVHLSFQQYLKMPTSKERPRYFHRRAFFWQVIVVAVINSGYVLIGLVNLSHRSKTWIATVIFVLVASAQFLAYYLFCRQRERGEIG